MITKRAEHRLLAGLGSVGALGLVAASSFAGAAGCSTLSVNCTLIGCDDQVTVTITNAPGGPFVVDTVLDGTTVHFTVDLATHACSSSDPTLGQCDASGTDRVVLTAFLGDGFEAETAELQVTVKDQAGVTLLDQKKTLGIVVTQPNGEDCEPTCHQAATELKL